ncbi:hypothetical protein J15TS10_27150 [Paenibacillus woosongensis]|uniref:Uncharacterized protein n=1 Tax=Paenibacillus woosongensis TaxID=307580 RepID=A0ABQ4MSG1_9BACL|nr:hypothetical protein J15TS10_27150 [Paenibacillus woosongensis]
MVPIRFSDLTSQKRRFVLALSNDRPILKLVKAQVDHWFALEAL